MMRRVFWNIYAWPVTLLIALAYAKDLEPLSVLDLVITLPSLVALHLHIWDRRFLSGTFWKAYAFAFLLWDLLYNIIIEPALSGKSFNPEALIAPAIFIPLYVGLFRYAFRSWDVAKKSNKTLQATAAPPRS